MYVVNEELKRDFSNLSNEAEIFHACDYGNIFGDYDSGQK